MLFASASSLALLARRHDTLPPMLQSGIFGMGLTALLSGIALLQPEPCRDQQFIPLVGLLGLSLLLIVGSMLRKRSRYERHA